MRHESISLSDLPTIEEVQSMFEDWRGSRESLREPIPHSLWQHVSFLIGRYHSSDIQKKLGINYYKLKQFISELPTLQSPLPEEFGHKDSALQQNPHDINDTFIKISLSPVDSVPSDPVTHKQKSAFKHNQDSQQSQPYPQIELTHPNGITLRMISLPNHQVSSLLSLFMGAA